jgi:CIC family chloride channel protein
VLGIAIGLIAGLGAVVFYLALEYAGKFLLGDLGGYHVGSGIGAIFGAPLGGAVLAASIVYREDFDYKSQIPGFITSATGYAVFGFDPGFRSTPTWRRFRRFRSPTPTR